MSSEINYNYDTEFIKKLNEHYINVVYIIEQHAKKENFIKQELYILQVEGKYELLRIINMNERAYFSFTNDSGSLNYFEFEELFEIIMLVGSKVDELNKAKEETKKQESSKIDKS